MNGWRQKIADKGLKRLEKAGYIKQEKLRKYIKISFYLPDPDKTKLFYAKGKKSID